MTAINWPDFPTFTYHSPIWRHRVSGKEIDVLVFATFWLNILSQLNIKSENNLKTKNSGIVLTAWAMFVPIFTFLFLLLGGEKCHLFAAFGLFCVFCQFCHN